jgi:hypothetical protein
VVSATEYFWLAGLFAPAWAIVLALSAGSMAGSAGVAAPPTSPGALPANATNSPAAAEATPPQVSLPESHQLVTSWGNVVVTQPADWRGGDSYKGAEERIVSTSISRDMVRARV